jgi:8-oxo-dGTP pyrophosphatase MutT (NUDIX family)
MQQSYKVFIENGSLELRNNKVRQTENVLDAQQLDPDTEGNDLLQLAKNQNVVYRSSKVDKTFKAIFKGYKKINAAGGIVEKDGNYLVIKRNGVWDLPKGKVELEEEIELAAIREVEEECGITSPVIVDELILSYHTYIMKRKNILKTTYWYYMKYEGDEKLVPQTEEGIEEVKWVTLDELIALKSEIYHSLIQVIEALESILKEKDVDAL